MTSVNVELKARDPDPEATAARCLAVGAVDGGTLRQRDTYFAARRGRLKLRIEEGALGGELIAYRRDDATDVNHRPGLANTRRAKSIPRNGDRTWVG